MTDPATTTQHVSEANPARDLPLHDLDGFTHRWVDADGIRLHAVEAANRQARLLSCSPGSRRPGRPGERSCLVSLTSSASSRSTCPPRPLRAPGAQLRHPHGRRPRPRRRASTRSVGILAGRPRHRCLGRLLPRPQLREPTARGRPARRWNPRHHPSGNDSHRPGPGVEDLAFRVPPRARPA